MPSKSRPTFRKCYTIDGIDYEFDSVPDATDCAFDLLHLGAHSVTIQHRLIRTDIQTPDAATNADPNLHPFAG